MWSQANELGRRMGAPKSSNIPVAEGVPPFSEGSTSEAIRRVEGGTGGVVVCGTVEEEGPVTWEALVRPAG
jgi:hypothetical protein